MSIICINNYLKLLIFMIYLKFKMHVKLLISNLEFTKSQSKRSSQLIILNLQFPQTNSSNQEH